MTVRGQWSVRLLRRDEARALHRLSVECFGEGAHTESFVDQRFCRCDPGKADVVVAEHGGRLVGAQAVSYLTFLVAGRAEPAGMFTDGMTHPDYRRKGIFRALLAEASRRAWERGTSLLFTMPNDRSLPSFARAPEWHILPDRVLLARVLDASGFLEDRGITRPLARPIGAIARWVAGNHSRMDAAGLAEVNGLAPFAADLDALAAAMGARFNVLCARRFDFLDWRFAKNPTWRYRYFIARDNAGRLGACLITAAEQRMGTRLAYAADLSWTNDPLMLRLIGFAASALKKDGARLFGSIVSSPQLVRLLAAAGFRRVPRLLSKRAFYTAYAVHPDRPDVGAVAALRDGWFLSLADFDTI